MKRADSLCLKLNVTSAQSLLLILSPNVLATSLIISSVCFRRSKVKAADVSAASVSLQNASAGLKMFDTFTAVQPLAS